MFPFSTNKLHTTVEQTLLFKTMTKLLKYRKGALPGTLFEKTV